MNGKSHNEISQKIKSTFDELSKDRIILVGIDAPRMPLQKPREYKWNGKIKNWQKNFNSKGYGKHAEVIIKSAGIANPQWTRTINESPNWMKLGYSIFNSPNEFQTYEVFPSATYSLLKNNISTKMELVLKDFSQGPKDMLDAAAAALTVMEFYLGRGEELGGGDGLGTIVIPTKISNKLNENLLTYPK